VLGLSEREIAALFATGALEGPVPMPTEALAA
jgi:hypothetical protein